MQNIEEYKPTFIEKTSVNKARQWKAKYRCGCGNFFETYIHKVNSGHTKSCGCSRKGVNKVHGLKGSPTYSSWDSMKQRCTNPKTRSWKRYGGRGITYDPKWESFEGFLEDMGEKPGKGWDIDKIDNDGNYCKENCQWITRSENTSKRNRERKVNNESADS